MLRRSKFEEIIILEIYSPTTVLTLLALSLTKGWKSVMFGQFYCTVEDFLNQITYVFRVFISAFYIAVANKVSSGLQWNTSYSRTRRES